MAVEYKTGFVPAPGALVVAVVATIALVGVAVAAVWFGAGFWIKAVCISLAAAVVVGFPARFRQIRMNQWNKQRRLAGNAPGQGKQKALENLRDKSGGVEAIGGEELPQLLAESPARPPWGGFPTWISRLGSAGRSSSAIWPATSDDADREPVLLKELGDKYLGVARRPLQEAIALTEHGENIYWDLLDLLVEADMCIPGPGLHTGGWAGDSEVAWPALDEYQALLKPLRYRQPLREVYKDPVSRLQVVEAARSHLGACVDYAAGRPTNRGRHSLTSGLRGRSAKKALPPTLVSDMRSFAGLVDRIEPDDYTISVSEALHIYFLARSFGHKVLDAAGAARRLAAALEGLLDECGGMEAIGSDELVQLLAEEADRPLWGGIPDLDQPTGIGRAFIERYLASNKRRRR